MSRKYSFLIVGIALTLLLVSCSKDEPSPVPTPPPAPAPIELKTVKELTLQDNVMSYTPPQGQEAQYILSYEKNVLKLKYDKVSNLRTSQASIYGRQKGKDFIPSDPKQGDVISITPNSFFPNGFTAKIDQAEYGAGFVNIYTSPTQVDDVAKEINYSETINLVQLMLSKWGSVTTDISHRLKESSPAEGKGKTVKSLGGKVSAEIKGENIELTATFDALRDSKIKAKAELGVKLSLNPNISFRIRKKAQSDLPELFEVGASGKVELDIDAQLKAELKKKSSGTPVYLAIIPLPPISLGALNIVSYLSVDLIFSLDGNVQAQIKVFKYHYPYEYKAGYDESRSKRWYLEGNSNLRSSADWLNTWSIEASLNLGVDLRSALNVTINGWEDLRVSAGAGVGTDMEIKASADKEIAELLGVKCTYEPFFFAEAVFKPGVDWFEFNSNHVYKPQKPKTLFEKKLSRAWSVRIEPKEAWEVTAHSAILGGDIKLAPNNPPQIIEFGLCLAEHANPELTDRVFKYDSPQSTLSYTIKATDLRPDTEYYYRGYAKYLSGGQTKIYYSSSVRSFTTEADNNVLPEGVVIQQGILKKWPNTSIPENGHVTLPSEVTIIGDGAFNACSRLKSITFPSKLKAIGSSAFNGCSQLKEVQIPNSVTNIGSEAFRGCINLHTVELPNKLNVLAAYTFDGCQALKTIKTKSVHTIERYVFNGCVKLENIEFTDALMTIGYNAFRDCRSLTQVSLPHSVRSVGENSFQGCIKLKEVQLSESMERIDFGLFLDCRSLTQITLPSRIRVVTYNAFVNCSALKVIKSNALYAPNVYYNNSGSRTRLVYQGKLIVPAGSKESYAKSVEWGHCDPIVEED